MLLKHSDMKVLNLAPNLVDHIDMLIGGSTINNGREVVVCNSCYWNDWKALEELVESLRQSGKLT